uniref:Putative two-pore potassium channel 1-like n=1 Tax=Davidia involucrata TaxID=16924 RepID=A0A5B7B6E8_DAVIN
MAQNGAKEPLLSGLSDPTPQTNQTDAPRRRRFRHCRSAPLAEFLHAEIKGTSSLPRSESIFGQLHPSFKKVAMLLAIYIGVGAVCFYLVRYQIEGKKTDGILDAVYFCIVTMTTVGYGDLVPNSVPTKLLACAFVFTGMALIGLILSKAADYLVEKQEMLLVKTLHVRQKVGPAEILKETETYKVRHKCIMVLTLLLVLIVIGTIFLATVEKLDIVDAFYCVCSTITTLGYGDKSFSTRGGRIFAIFWILASTICLAQFFLYVAELNTESRQRALVKWVLTRRMTNMDLEAADLDGDGVVGAAEFVIYKLKEMGKINEEDISLIMEEFEDLDVDQSGALSASDIMLAQSSQTGRGIK